eukprot:COSAG01_NODE_6068_length_3872_cov_3.778426_5_plen_269_part_00
MVKDTSVSLRCLGVGRPVACARWQRAGERAEGAGAAPVLHASFSTSAVAKSEDESTLPAELKTGGPGYGLTLGIVGAGYIMNQEMYVINDETMLAAGWLGLMAIFVNMGSASVAEMLDTRAKEIETALVEQRQAEQDAVDTMIAKAQDAISVNEELIAVCDPANFDAWTALKMEKTLQKAKNDSAAATLRKLVRFCQCPPPPPPPPAPPPRPHPFRLPPPPPPPARWPHHKFTARAADRRLWLTNCVRRLGDVRRRCSALRTPQLAAS